MPFFVERARPEAISVNAAPQPMTTRDHVETEQLLLVSIAARSCKFASQSRDQAIAITFVIVYVRRNPQAA